MPNITGATVEAHVAAGSTCLASSKGTAMPQPGRMHCRCAPCPSSSLLSMYCRQQAGHVSSWPQGRRTLTAVGEKVWKQTQQVTVEVVPCSALAAAALPPFCTLLCVSASLLRACGEHVVNLLRAACQPSSQRRTFDLGIDCGRSSSFCA